MAMHRFSLSNILSMWGYVCEVLLTPYCEQVAVSTISHETLETHHLQMTIVTTQIVTSVVAMNTEWQGRG